MRIGPLLSCAVLLAVMAPASLGQEAYDFVVDGTGNPWYRADVAIAGDRVVAVWRVDRSRARRVIDARGLWVTPGFIDPTVVRETATFTDPHQLSEGIVHLLVNGQLVIDDGRFTGALSGQVLSQR